MENGSSETKHTRRTTREAPAMKKGAALRSTETVRKRAPTRRTAAATKKNTHTRQGC